MRTKKFLAMAIALGLAVGMTAMPTLAAEKKTLVFGDTTFNWYLYCIIAVCDGL